MSRARRLTSGVALLLASTCGRARADDVERTASDLPPAVEARADDVSFDARQRELLLRGNVRLDSPPFYLTSDELQVKRTRFGAEVTGKGNVAFCPCLGTPLSVGFDGATVAPPADLFVKDPTLRVYGVPVFWLPFFWLRSPGRVGLLPPTVEYRGKDGMLLGGGVHVPWKPGDLEGGLDVRGGGYTVGGAMVDVQARTAATTTRVRWDQVHGADGVTIDARGAVGPAAWDIDAIRGERGVLSTTSLEAASRAFDRAGGEASYRTGPFTIATGVRAASLRGAGLAWESGAAGPIASMRMSEAIGGVGALDATIDGGQLRGDGLGALSFARAEGGTTFATHLGAVGASLGVRGAGDVADDGERSGKDGAASARAELALPFARGYASSDPADPVRHRIEPRVAVGVLGSHEEGVLGALPGRGAALVSGAAWFAEGSILSAIGRWAAREGNEIEASMGAVGGEGGARPVFRWRAATTSRWIGTASDAARVFPGAGPSGTAGVSRYRIGRVDSVHAGVLLAAREGVDPIVARILTDAPLEPASGLLAATGFTGGARLAVPWTSGVLTSLGADGDLSARELLAARAAIELRDRCNCLVVRASGAHRLGRPGVDIALTVDFVPPSR